MSTLPLTAAGELWTRWARRSKRVRTVLAPALPALILLAVTTAGMVDPPRAGLQTQMHLTSTQSEQSAQVTAR